MPRPSPRRTHRGELQSCRELGPNGWACGVHGGETRQNRTKKRPIRRLPALPRPPRAAARFREAGAEAVSDYELLELALFRAIPQRDVKPLAKKLIAKFGSFAEMVAAPVTRLGEVKGLGEAAITELKVVHAAAGRLARGEVRKRTVLSSWGSVLDYCRTTMAFAEKEQFRVLFLDKRNQLIADEVQQTGTVDHTPVYPREVIKRALELSATAIILVHNHPSGDPTPSRADIQMTQAIVDVAKPLGIAVHDHIIVGKEGHASFKGLRLI